LADNPFAMKIPAGECALSLAGSQNISSFLPIPTMMVNDPYSYVYQLEEFGYVE
jgi:hypothetical protein